MTLPRHILMTADTVGGVWTYAVELARGLTSLGIQVSLATMGGPLSWEQRSEARFRNIELYESSYKLEWMADAWKHVDAAGDWLLRLTHQLQPDLIHLNSYAHGKLEWQAPVLVVAHSCVFSWWDAVHGVAPPSEWTEYRRRVSEGLQAADMIVGVSCSMLRELQRWYGPMSEGIVIYNGHRSGAYQPAAKQEFVLSTGRLWDAAKNITTLDSAAPHVPWPVYVAGEAQHPDGGRPLLRNVTAIGKLSREEIRPWFARAAVYALPALYEPFGLSVLEAALSGCALVLGDIPSLREIWGDAALFVSPSDPESLANAINSLIAKPTIRDDFGRLARERALIFTTDRMMQGYLNVYAQSRANYGAAREVETSCVS
jgi:glycosyltransferase involved in cell wall biosynthesis